MKISIEKFRENMNLYSKIWVLCLNLKKKLEIGGSQTATKHIDKKFEEDLEEEKELEKRYSGKKIENTQNAYLVFIEGEQDNIQKL